MKKNGCPIGEILVREKCIPKDKSQPGSELIDPIHRLTLEERKLQKKTASYLHKTLNKKGIKVQFKGLNDEYNRAVIQLPNKLWLFVGIDKGKPDYTIGKDRCSKNTGCEDKLFYDDNQKLLLKELPDVIEEAKYNKPIIMRVKCEIDEKNRCVDCDGKAGPYVSSGSEFGMGVCKIGNIKAMKVEAERYIDSEKNWLENSYHGRKVIVKKEIKIIKKKKKRGKKK